MTQEKSYEHLKRIEMGFILSQLRKELNINPYSISKLANINPDIVLNIEKGASKYSIDSLLKYLSALDLDLQFVKVANKVSWGVKLYFYFWNLPFINCN